MLEYIKESWSQIRQLFGEPDDVKEERLLAEKTSVLPLEDSHFGKVETMVHSRKKYPNIDPENGVVDHLIVLVLPKDDIRGVNRANWFFVPQSSFKFQLQIVPDQDEQERTDTFETQLMDLDTHQTWREGNRGRDPRLGNPDA